MISGNESCVKVVHDFRASSDLLFHQFGLKLINVFDTMAGHIVVTNWMVERKMTRANRLYCLVLDYIGWLVLISLAPVTWTPGLRRSSTWKHKLLSTGRECNPVNPVGSVV